MVKLVIVESPAKAKKLKDWLSKEYRVEASVGHIRDLPSGASKVPERYKERTVKHGIIIEKDHFEPIYVATDRGAKVIADLKKKMKGVDELFLATDPDREGESISWHLKEALAPKVPARRVVFHEITKKAIQEAFAHPRAIDQELVNAQEARRVLDRLVGYELSPLLWTKIATGLSAGRVQSVALWLLVDRERSRMAFKTSAYWDLLANLAKGSEAFDARIHTLDGKEVANGKRFFDDATGKLLEPEKVVLLDETTAKALAADLLDATWKVASVEEQARTSKPLEPFITDTLVSAANNQLGLSARDAMRIAQSLYENGFITYHRTDSPSLSVEGLAAARAAAKTNFGAEYLSPEPRIYAAKGANAQEAHEAIRPAGETFQQPKETGLAGRELDVYLMIWRRALASQMADERFTSTTVLIEALTAMFKATGKFVDFAGWRKAYTYEDADEHALPRLAQGDGLTCNTCDAEAHETKPPARYTEGSLIKALKENGVGRPSTYAATVETLLNKNYCFLQGKALVPTFTGFAVTQLLERHFPAIIDVGFTAKMEEELDEIASGKAEWMPYLARFWSGPKGLEAQVAERKSQIDPREVATIVLPQLSGIDAILRMGRYGPYLETKNKEGEVARANVPQDIAPADLDRATVERLVENASKGVEPIGTDSASGEPVFLLDGRFGPYVQLGMPEEGSKKKPPRSSLPRGMNPADVTLEDALFLLSLPRPLGEHPEGGTVVAGLGRFGPYVMHEKTDGTKDYRSLKDPNQLRTATLDEAVAMLAQPKFGRGSRAAPTVLKELGAHPEDGAPIQVLSGRYGPYVKHGQTNATIPQGQDPATLTIETAVELLKARQARDAEGGGKKRRPVRRRR
ncbi:MAG TPA: type I DNA topoisomerase [Candidatus Thermoplasmatota archaeon]